MTAYHSVKGDAHAPHIALETKVLVKGDLRSHELLRSHAKSRSDRVALLHVDREAEIADLSRAYMDRMLPL